MTAHKAYLWVNTAGSLVLRLGAFSSIRSSSLKLAPIVNDLFLQRLVGGYVTGLMRFKNRRPNLCMGIFAVLVVPPYGPGLQEAFGDCRVATVFETTTSFCAKAPRNLHRHHACRRPLHRHHPCHRFVLVVCG